MPIRFLEGKNFWILGIPLRTAPKREEDLFSGLIYTIMQNFTPIGVTVAKLSVAAQEHTHTPDLISDKTHTSLCRIMVYKQ